MGVICCVSAFCVCSMTACDVKEHSAHENNNNLRLNTYKAWIVESWCVYCRCWQLLSRALMQATVIRQGLKSLLFARATSTFCPAKPVHGRPCWLTCYAQSHRPPCVKLRHAALSKRADITNPTKTYGPHCTYIQLPSKVCLQ